MAPDSPAGRTATVDCVVATSPVSAWLMRGADDRPSEETSLQSDGGKTNAASRGTPRWLKSTGPTALLLGFGGRFRCGGFRGGGGFRRRGRFGCGRLGGGSRLCG